MNAAQHILVAGVRFYRWVISPAKTLVFGPLGQCRYSPSCSEYAIDAVRLRGALTGSWLAIKRIGRCHPWGGCGWDPVPNPRILDAAREETACCGGPNSSGGGLPKGGSFPARGISLNNTATAAAGAVTRHS